jgi:uncharacterized RDD family membrane protein YckC
MIEMRYRTFWRRLGAGIVDSIVFLPVAICDRMVWEHWQSVSPAFLVPWHVVTTLMWCAYSICLHGRFGRTVGKLALGIKVVDVLGENRLGYFGALKRDAVPLLVTVAVLPKEIGLILAGDSYLQNPGQPLDASLLLVAYLQAAWMVLEIVTMSFSCKRRAVHDLIAGSVVIVQPTIGHGTGPPRFGP